MAPEPVAAAYIYEPSVPYEVPGVAHQPRQTINVWKCNSALPDDALWVIFIHGGGWRDPCIDSESFNQTADALLDGSGRERIAGLASISYRLSSYPKHPTFPSSPDDAGRNVQHPAHLEDVEHAIRFLQNRHGFGSKYILVGHSAGATLAWQLSLRSESTKQVVKPMGIVGFASVFDLPAFLATHRSIPAYAEIVENAFGTLDDRSLMTISPSGILRDEQDPLAGIKISLIVCSGDDELVENSQAINFMKELAQVNGHELQKGVTRGETHLGRMIRVEGGVGHDELWNREGGLAKEISLAIDLVKETAKI